MAAKQKFPKNTCSKCSREEQSEEETVVGASSLTAEEYWTSADSQGNVLVLRVLPKLLHDSFP